MNFSLLAIYVLILGIRYWLKYLNISHLVKHGQLMPAEFQGVIEASRLQKIAGYTIENIRLGIIGSVVENSFVILLLYSGLLGAYDRWITSSFGNSLQGGVMFFLIMSVANTIVEIPFSLYRTFAIENRYGFNTMTVRLWIMDLLKTIALGALFGTVIVVSALAIIEVSPQWWWVWVWLFFLFMGLFVTYISPYVIEPLFFKFQQVKAPELEEKILKLMQDAGLKVSRVLQVDASRRSRHSNAYFTGIGRVKRIVLFDTLIEQMNGDEILAILAHEVGHWKKKHVLKRMVLGEAVAFFGLYFAFLALGWSDLPGLFGYEDLSLFGRIVLIVFLGSLVMFPLTPLFSFLSRKDENESDRYASDLTRRPDALASALVKLSQENLSNLHPHPIYAWFYFSHPPVVERVQTLKKMPDS